jgi:hypothetical protein
MTVQQLVKQVEFLLAQPDFLKVVRNIGERNQGVITSFKKDDYRVAKFVLREAVEQAYTLFEDTLKQMQDTIL